MIRKKQIPSKQLYDVRNHVKSELETLQSLAQLLTAPSQENFVIQKMQLESFLIHASLLIEFLYNDKRKARDIRAKDFFDSPKQWKALRPDKSRLLALVAPAANKHLDDPSSRGLQKIMEWPFKSITNGIERVMTIFLDNIPEELKKTLNNI
ncbi:MAG: hypothetical protein ACYSWP_11915 [Planctomycetota bacterium]|jgi:hypothetical protein